METALTLHNKSFCFSLMGVELESSAFYVSIFISAWEAGVQIVISCFNFLQWKYISRFGKYLSLQLPIGIFLYYLPINYFERLSIFLCNTDAK